MSHEQPVNIGIVGMGFMGTTHLLAGSGLKAGRIGAIVTSDPRKARGDFRGVRGNFGPGGARVDLTGIKVYPSLDAMLADGNVDLVDICLPSFLHATAALRSLRRGKHVLVEKPVALRPEQAHRMGNEARKRRRLLMVAQVLKYFPEFALLKSGVEGGRWGKLLALHLRRTISMPDWGAGSWFSDPSKSGGMAVDLHIHDTDFMIHLFGKPRAVSSRGLVRGGRLDFLRTVYLYGRHSPLLSAEAGWLNAPGLPFQHGYEAHFEKATIHFDSARAPRPVLHDAKGSRPLELPVVDAFGAELEEAAVAVRRGRPPKGLSASLASVALAVCRSEEKAARTGKTIEVE